MNLTDPFQNRRLRMIWRNADEAEATLIVMSLIGFGLVAYIGLTSSGGVFITAAIMLVPICAFGVATVVTRRFTPALDQWMIAMFEKLEADQDRRRNRMRRYIASSPVRWAAALVPSEKREGILADIVNDLLDGVPHANLNGFKTLVRIGARARWIQLRDFVGIPALGYWFVDHEARHLGFRLLFAFGLANLGWMIGANAIPAAGWAMGMFGLAWLVKIVASEWALARRQRAEGSEEQGPIAPT